VLVPQESQLFFVRWMDCGVARLRLPIGVREVLGQNRRGKHLVRVDDMIQFDVDRLGSFAGRPVLVRSLVRLTEDGAATDHAAWISTDIERLWRGSDAPTPKFQCCCRGHCCDVRASSTEQPAGRPTRPASTTAGA
jgi:hypothetical protein